MKKTFFEFSKVVIIAFLLIGIIIGGLTLSLYVLKDEAVKTHLKIASLHGNTFSEQIFQTFNYIDLATQSITATLNTDDVKLMDEKFNTILRNTPYIRSINILDENKKIISSSNSLNVGLNVDINEFYPKPMFDQKILRFGETKFGRDIFDTQKKLSQVDESISYLPLVKKVTTENNIYYILINLNTEYFTNRYIDSLDDYYATLEIIRLDGVVLYSSNFKVNRVGERLEQSDLIKTSLDKSISNGVENLQDKKFMSAYHLTNKYPLNISIKLDYQKSLIEWEEKRKKIILLTTALVSLIVFLIFIIIYRQNKEKNRELEFHKKEIDNQRKFRTLFEQNIFLAAIIDDDGSIDDINQIALEFLGKSCSEAKGNKFYELDCWNEEEKALLKDMFIVHEKKIDTRKEIEVSDSKGNKHVMEFILKSLEIDGTYKVFALALDITEKKERIEKLKHAYIVYQNTHDGIIITDKDANIIDVNNAFIKSSGYTLEEVRGKNPRLLKSGKSDDKVYEKMWQEILENGYWNGELVNKNKDGSFYDELLTINSVHDEKGELHNYIGIFTNISKQKDQEKKLKEQEHLLFQQSKMASMGEMLENIAHQWRQPLSVISMSASGIKLKDQLGVIDKEYLYNSLDGIVKGTQYLSKTIDDFRDFFKPDKEKVEVLISDVVERTLGIVSSKFKNRDIDVIKDIDEVKLSIYDNELIQVIMNILKNSQDVLEKFEEGKERFIFISAKKDQDKLIFTMKDNGGGIPEDIIGRIFEPYFTTKHQSQGTGIGLYMSEEIISKHMDGNISVKNEEYSYEDKKYKGAIFTIELPL